MKLMKTALVTTALVMLANSPVAAFSFPAHVDRDLRCDPEQRRAITNEDGDILYYNNPSCKSVGGAGFSVPAGVVAPDPGNGGDTDDDGEGEGSDDGNGDGSGEGSDDGNGGHSNGGHSNGGDSDDRGDKPGKGKGKGGGRK